METKPVDVYSEETNLGIVRMPGRNYPGCVIQGDSLHVLLTHAEKAAECVREGRMDDELRLAVQQLHNSLLTRLLHYQKVIQKEGMTVPYYRPVDAKPVRLLPGEEELP